MRRLLSVIAVVLASLCAAPAGAEDKGFSDWAAVVVAGDWHAHDGGTTLAFDNARRDVTQGLYAIGFKRANVREFSLRPTRPGDDPNIVITDPNEVVRQFDGVAKQATGGCLFYVTSHGSPDGALFGPNTLLRPGILHRLLDNVCGARPTVVVISACFSGVFVPELSAPNRMVMTAARPDRSSFGCSDKDKYPYFDECILKSLPEARDFIVLSRKTRECVAKKEADFNLSPSSEPQTYVGGEIGLLLPFMQFGATH